MSRARRLATVGALFACALMGAPAFADEPTAPKMPKPDPAPVSARAWGAANPTCLEWTDACLVCTRGTNGAMNCSTPGVACQPQRLTCTRTAPAKTP